MKPDVRQIEEHGVIFADKSTANVDVICYCTGKPQFVLILKINKTKKNCF